MNVYILDDFVPDEHTLKYKSYIDKLIISSHGMEMMNLSYEVGVDISIGFIYILKSFRILNGSIFVIVYSCSVV